MKFIINKIFIITLIFMMIQACCFFVASTNIAIFIPFALLSFTFIFFLRPKEFFYKLWYAYQNTPFKYFVFFILFCALTVVISCFTGTFFLRGFIRFFIGGLLCYVVLPIVLIIFCVPKYISLKFIYKFIFLFSWFVFLLGIIDFIVFNLHIVPLQKVLTMFSNARFALGADVFTHAASFGLTRARSIFEEPSYLGHFMFFISPILYEMCYCKQNIFYNIKLDKITKITIIPFMWISLIMCQSPVFLIFNIIFTMIYFLLIRKYYKVLLKNFIIFIIILLFILFVIFYCFMNIDVTETFLNRIIIFIQNVKSLEELILAEQSLGTRIVTFINSILLGIKHLLTGVGYGNMSNIMLKQLLLSPVALTSEIKNLIINDSPTMAAGIFVKVFADTGIIGIGLFYLFLIKLWTISINLKKSFFSIDYAFMHGSSIFIINYIVSTFYASSLHQPIIFVLLGIIIAIQMHIKKRIED